mgnify:FL=1|jgi:hypothetical protein
MDKKQVKGIADMEAKKEVKAHEKRMHAKGFYKGGKTNESMLKYGRGMAKVANQKTGVK